MAGSLAHWHHSAAASRARLRTLRKALVRIKNLCMSRSFSAWICMVGERRDARLRLEQAQAHEKIASLLGEAESHSRAKTAAQVSARVAVAGRDAVACVLRHEREMAESSLHQLLQAEELRADEAARMLARTAGTQAVTQEKLQALQTQYDELLEAHRRSVAVNESLSAQMSQAELEAAEKVAEAKHEAQREEARAAALHREKELAAAQAAMLQANWQETAVRRMQWRMSRQLGAILLRWRLASRTLRARRSGEKHILNRSSRRLQSSVFISWVALLMTERTRLRQMQRVLLQVSRSSLRRAFRSWALLTSREAAPPQASCAVTLVGTELMSSMWTGDYTVYLLEVDVNTGVEGGVSGVFRLQTRYSEFYALHKQLASMLERETMLALALKNMMPPPVPDKNSQRVVAQRRSALQQYLTKVWEIADMIDGVRPLLFEFLQFHEGVSQLAAVAAFESTRRTPKKKARPPAQQSEPDSPPVVSRQAHGYVAPSPLGEGQPSAAAARPGPEGSEAEAEGNEAEEGVWVPDQDAVYDEALSHAARATAAAIERAANTSYS